MLHVIQPEAGMIVHRLRKLVETTNESHVKMC